jgi:hypothetical protein
MNAGLSSLEALKDILLPTAALRASTDYDEALVQLGKGVAAQMQKHCNRKWQRVEDDVHEFSADCISQTVPRYPVEDIAAIDIKRSGETAWEDILDDYLANFFAASGVIEFTGILGTHRDKVRVTYTGGYWWDDGEEAEPQTLPEGATAVPDDLLHAWHLQCQAEAEHTGLVKARIVRAEDEESNKSMRSLDLLPQVKNILLGYIRHG